MVSLGGMNDPGIFMLADLDEVVGELFLDCWVGVGDVSRPTPFLGACPNDIACVRVSETGLMCLVCFIRKLGFWPYYTTEV